MRKPIAFIVAGAVMAALFVAPAVAGGKGKGKHVHGSFGATLLPFPKDTRWEVTGPMRPGCTAGQEGVHWTTQEFTAPGKGTLRFYAEGFTGDHDIYIFAEDKSTVLLRGDQVQVGGTEMAPPEEEITFAMTKGQKIVLAACNWLGQPEVEAHYEGHFK